MEAPIAETKFWLRRNDGSVTPISIAVFRPEPMEDHAVCRMGILGIDDKIRKIYGEDTFQALSLALRHLRGILETNVGDGIITLPNECEPINWRVFFP